MKLEDFGNNKDFRNLLKGKKNNKFLQDAIKNNRE